MPHIIVKMYPGRSKEQKQKLTQAINKSVIEITNCDPAHVSVAIEEIEKDKWAETVYKSDILDKQDTLSLEPRYNPFTK